MTDIEELAQRVLNDDAHPMGPVRTVTTMIVLAVEVLRLRPLVATAERERDEARIEAERLRAALVAREQDLSLAMEVVHRGEVEIARLGAALDGLPCQACNGDGVISWDADAGGNHVEYSAGCIKCDGTGKNPDAQKALRGET